MKTFKLILLVVLSICLVTVVVQNTQPVETHFLWLSTDLPAILLLFLVTVAAFVSGLLVAMRINRGSKTKRKKEKTATSQ